MLPGMELMGCTGLAVPGEVMQHVVRIESSRNPYAIGVVGGRLVREPRGLAEAVATAKMLEQKGYNFSLGLGQVNRYNLQKYGLATYEMAFDKCPNLVAASKILAECHSRSGANWGSRLAATTPEILKPASNMATCRRSMPPFVSRSRLPAQSPSRSCQPARCN